MKIFLMLDKDDITKCHGSISSKEIREELHINQSQLFNFISFGKIFRGKYILIEDETNDKRNELTDLLFYESDNRKRYYATRNGKFYVVYKSGKKKYLSGYLKKKRDKKILVVKVGSNKEFVAKNLIASLFINEYKPQDTVILKDNNPKNVSVDNLIVIDKAKYARMTGAMARSRKVGLYENGKLIKTYRSSREAGKKLFCSYQMVSDICNNKWKKKEFDLRWV